MQCRCTELFSIIIETTVCLKDPVLSSWLALLTKLESIIRDSYSANNATYIELRGNSVSFLKTMPKFEITITTGFRKLIKSSAASYTIVNFFSLFRSRGGHTSLSTERASLIAVHCWTSSSTS